MKLFIMGPSGAGTTTLGKKLGSHLSVEQVDSDQLFWEETDPPFTDPREVGELHSLFKRAIENEVIISGDVLNWGMNQNFLIQSFTHLIYLYVPWEIRERRIHTRDKARFGSRILEGGDMHTKHEAFLSWARGYETDLHSGRNLTSQKHFYSQFKKQGRPCLEFKEEFDMDFLVQMSTDFLR
ncbi:MAG: hypothetical protein KC478_09060 [Bacteriovoracaceae bacterium]|nr:hypothetical protein [Bacteriovoracaceae bacterium]